MFFFRDEMFCDVTLATEDGTIIKAHKVILASANRYFHAMFTQFEGKIKDHITIKELSSTALKLVVDFIYSCKIMLTEENVQVLYILKVLFEYIVDFSLYFKDLLHVSNFLHICTLEDACCQYLETQLDPTNCLGIRALAQLYGCMGLLSSS